jgi:flagellar basal-body rod protein FlgB
MLPAMFGSTTIPLLEQVVQFSEARHNVLAGNIANYDTPGYRVRDLSPVQFESQLKQAVEAHHRQATEADGGEAVDSGQNENAFSPVRDSSKNLVYHDDSNVDLEQQAAELTKNQLQYNLAVSVMTSQFRLLQAAISERA